jgi:hypothetical protein
MTSNGLPESITDFLHEIARLRHPGAATFAASVADGNPDPEAEAGELMIYARTNGKVVDGRTMIAIGGGGKIVFGRAVQSGANVGINDQLFPRHTVRGVVIAAIRDISAEE